MDGKSHLPGRTAAGHVTSLIIFINIESIEDKTEEKTNVVTDVLGKECFQFPAAQAIAH